MRPKNLFLFILMLLAVNYLPAQHDYDLTYDWDYVLKENGFEKFHKIIAGTNGMVIAVGETLGSSARELDGLFVVMDAIEGKRVYWQKLGGEGDQSINGIVQNHDGTFTLVGYNTYQADGGKDGWVVQVNLQGEVLYEAQPKTGNGQTEVLNDVAINTKGEIMALGAQEHKNGNYPWMVQVGNEQILKNKVITEDGIRTATGIVAGADQNFVMVGSTNDAHSHPEDVWVRKVDYNFSDPWGGAKYYGGNGLQEGWDIAASTLDGGYAVTGATDQQTAGETDIWLIKISEAGQLQWQKKFGKHAAEVGKSVIGLAAGGFAVLGHSWSYLPKADYSELIVYITDAQGNVLDDERCPIITAHGGEEAASIIELFSNDQIVIAGNDFPGKRNKNDYPTTRLASYTYWVWEPVKSLSNQGSGSKFTGALSISYRDFSDADGNNFLGAQERGYLVMEVTNNTQNTFYDVSSKVVANGTDPELDYWNEVKVGMLRGRETKQFMIPVAAKGRLTAGAKQLNVSINIGNDYAASSTAKIPTSSGAGPAYLIVDQWNYTPRSNPKPEQPIELNLIVANTGQTAAGITNAVFSYPPGITPTSSSTMSIPSLNPGDKKAVSFKFYYNQGYSNETIDITFKAKSQNSNNINEMYRMRLAGASMVEASTNPPAVNSTSTSSGDMDNLMIWVSHDPDENGSRTFSTNERDVEIKLKVLTRKQLDKKKMSLYINGKKAHGQKLDEEELTRPTHEIGRYSYRNMARLQEGKNEIKVVYEGEDGSFSSDMLVFDYTPKDKPSLHVLSIGVQYPDLKYTVKDAQDFANMYMALRDQGGGGFKDVDVKQLTRPEETTTNNIRAAFEMLTNKRNGIKKNDLLVIFLSTHGNTNAFGEYILLPSDYDSRAENTYSINFQDDILKPLRFVDCTKLVFIDACHSGNAFGEAKSFNDDQLSKMMNDIIRATPGIEIFASCADNEYSYEDDKWQNGAFTEAIIEAFQDKTVEVDGAPISADIYHDDPYTGVKKRGKDGVITIEELKRYIQKRVPNLVKTTKDSPATGQNPSNKSTDLLPENMGIYMINKD